MELELSQIWTAAGILLGFQVSSFSWRIAQELQVADRGNISWIPPADYLNFSAMLVAVFGVFVAPVLEVATLETAQMWFGLSAILFVGHTFSLAAHYELFNHKTKRSYQYFPFQEQASVIVVLLVSISYIVCWYTK